MKQQAYISYTTILLLTSFSAFALHEETSGLIAAPAQPNRSNNLHFAAIVSGFTCTAAVSGIAAFAAYKAPDLNLWQKCTIPAIASICTATGLRMFASSKIKSLQNAHTISSLINAISRVQGKRNLMPQGGMSNLRDIADLHKLIAKTNLNNPTEQESIRILLTDKLEQEKQATPEQQTYRIWLLEQTLDKLSNQELPNFLKNLAIQLATKIDEEDESAESSSEQETPAPVSAEKKWYNRLGLGSWLSAATITCASLYCYFFTK